MTVVNSVNSCREVKKDQGMKVFIDLATWRKVSYNFIQSTFSGIVCMCPSDPKYVRGQYKCRSLFTKKYSSLNNKTIVLSNKM